MQDPFRMRTRAHTYVRAHEDSARARARQVVGRSINLERRPGVNRPFPYLVSVPLQALEGSLQLRLLLLGHTLLASTCAHTRDIDGRKEGGKG